MPEEPSDRPAEVFDKNGERIGPILYRTYGGFVVQNETERKIERFEMVYFRAKPKTGETE